MYHRTSCQVDVVQRSRMLWYDWKGRLEEGYDGDITLVDMTTERTVDDAIRGPPLAGVHSMAWRSLDGQP